MSKQIINGWLIELYTYHIYSGYDITFYLPSAVAVAINSRFGLLCELFAANGVQKKR